MSRRGSSNARTSKAAAAHAANQELQRFLMRSLARNDKEIAALMDLHRSLRNVKEAILESCGEDTLLDLGEGRLQLAPSSDSLQVKAFVSNLPPTEGQNLCVDFLLRMKLRRKLLNRLSRRILRVAHAMDGGDVQPPAVPRFGEQRLHLDDERVKAFTLHAENKDMAKSIIAMVHENMYSSPRRAKPEREEEDDGEEPKENPNDKTAGVSQDVLEACYDLLRDYKDSYEKMVDPDTGDVTYPALLQPEPVVADTATGIGAAHNSMSVKEKEAELQRWKSALLNRIPDQPSFGELNPRVFGLKERRKRAREVKEEEDDAEGSKKIKTDEEEEEDSVKKEDEQEDSEKQEQSDEGDNHMDTEEDEEETEIKAEAVESEQEEVDEEKESLASDQEEDGSDNMDSDEKKESREPDENRSSDKVKTDDADEDMKEGDAKDDSKDYIDEDKPPETNSGKVEKAAEDVEKEEMEEDIQPLKKIFISLVPVPSFHDQDIKRIRMVHNDLMNASMQDFSRRRLEEVTREYNGALLKSNELYDRQIKLQEEVTRRRQQNAIMKSQQEAQTAQAREIYKQRMRQFNDQKLSNLLPSRFGRQRTGTYITQQYAHRDAYSHQIADCLADVVDAIEGIAQGSLINEKFNEPFRIPALPAEYSQNIQVENAIVQQSQTIMQSLRASEEDRHRAWKKMLKTRSELDMHPSIDPRIAANGAPPPLRTTTPQSLPRQAIRPSYATYTPTARIARTPAERPSHGTLSDSKYSAARIRERISEDGTVAPVTMPRKKDGLYLRPAGRTRKGMEWDAVNGVWVPQR